MYLKEVELRWELNSSSLGYGPAEGSCEHGNVFFFLILFVVPSTQLFVQINYKLYINQYCFSLTGHRQVYTILIFIVFLSFSASPPYTGQCLHSGSACSGF
jgi:hypothetical protein